MLNINPNLITIHSSLFTGDRKKEALLIATKKNDTYKNKLLV